jgi:hypothetical protein
MSLDLLLLDCHLLKHRLLSGERFNRTGYLRQLTQRLLNRGLDEVPVTEGDALQHIPERLTSQTYAHVMDATDRRAAEVIDGSISGI